MQELSLIQDWFAAQCDDEWECDYGIKITTIADPGWSLEIDLSETILEGRAFESIDVETSDDDWYHIEVVDNQFKGQGDPTKLAVIIRSFLDWARTGSQDWLSRPIELTPEEALKLSDSQFYNSLEVDTLGNRCKWAECELPRVVYGIYCRDHHFQMVKKYPYASDAT